MSQAYVYKLCATLAHHYLLIKVTSQISLHFRWHCFTIPLMVRSWSPCQYHLHGHFHQASEKDTSLFQDGHPPDSQQCWCWEDRHLHHTRLWIHDREDQNYQFVKSLRKRRVLMVQTVVRGVRCQWSSQEVGVTQIALNNLFPWEPDICIPTWKSGCLFMGISGWL